jgi:hypothetical protein
LRGLSEQELGALKNWKKFFAKHAKYVKVGTVSQPPIDPNSPIPEPCEPPSAAGGGESAKPVGNPHAERNAAGSKVPEQVATGKVTSGHGEL